MKLVRDEANKFTSPEVLDKVRERLEEHLKGTRGVVVWPEGPGGIDDGKPLFSVAYLHPDWTPERTPLEAFVEQARSGPRRYRNGVAMVLPDATQFDQARQSTRSWVAAQSLLRQQAKYGFTAQQSDELKEKAESSQRSASTAVSRGYASVALPVKDRSGQAPYVLETIDLRSLLTAGRSLHERVEDALSQRVFSSLTVDKLIALAGLGPTKPAVTLGDLLDWFYSYFEFTKVWSRRVLAEAVSNAVVASRAGYAVGLIHGDDILEVRNPKLIRIGELLPSDEIDMSTEAALLEAGYAQRLLDAATTPAGTAEAEIPPTARIPVSSEPSGELASTPVVAGGEPMSPKRGESVARVDLKATLSKTGFFDLNRALSWLRDHAAKVHVEVTIHAEAGEPGFDRVQLRNGMIEPLEEGATNVSVDME
jgi:hypothetical protein